MLKSLSEQKTIRIDSDLVDDEAVIENLFNGGNCYVLFRVCYSYRKKTIDLFDTGNYHKKIKFKI